MNRVIDLGNIVHYGLKSLLVLRNGCFRSITKRLTWQALYLSSGHLIGFQCGAYHSPEGLSQGFTHGFTMTFADAAARDAYLPHPLHQAVVAKLLPMLDGGLDGVVAFDFIDGVMG
jgi:hypothetical protein